MTSKHVGEKSHSKRERTNDDGRNEFDWGDENVESLGYPWREQHRLEVAAKTLMLNSCTVVDNPHHECERCGQRHTCRCWHLQERNDSGNVAEINECEKREEEWCPAKAIAAHRLHNNAVLNELDCALCNVANTARSSFGALATSQHKHHGANGCRKYCDERDFIERREEFLPAKDLVNRRELKSDHVRFRFVLVRGQG